MANSFKNTTEKKNSPLPKPKSGVKSDQDAPPVQNLLKRTALIRIVGYLSLFLSIFFAIASLSYLFTGNADHDIITGKGWGILIDNEIVIENWMGKLGALSAYAFVGNGLGLGAFGAYILLSLIGLRLIFPNQHIDIWKWVVPLCGWILIAAVTLSFLFDHLFSANMPFLGGALGYQVNVWLIGVLGKLGTGLMLLLIWGVTLFTLFPKLSFSIPSNANSKSEATETEVACNSADKKVTTAMANLPVSAAEPAIDPESFALNTFDDELPFDPDEEDEGDNAFKIHKTDKTVLNDPSDFITVDPTVKAKENDNKFSFEIVDAKEAEEQGPKHAFELVKPVNENITDAEIAADELVAAQGPYDPRRDLSDYKFPILDLLNDHGSQRIQINTDELEQKKNQIIETLGHYNIEIDKIRATVGPTVTLYEIIPAAGVRISKIKNLEDDIALSLSALGIRIIAPMPGKGTIGIEVPNQKKEIVSMKGLLASEKFVNAGMQLPIALGKTISNEIFVADLAKMPHLLVAGATGQGKSVGINAILCSLLFKKHPSELKLILVDPKKVELSLYRKIERHFLAKLPGEEDAIITDNLKVVKTIKSLCIEMDQRYELLKQASTRTISEYNDKFIKRKLSPKEGHRFLPFIVLVIDEFADLIMTAGKEIELPIARLAQLARAVGIHLIVATQRPSVNIITGMIKANFPGRLAFKVLSKIDSRTILDNSGADQLIGQGDMLLLEGSTLTRIQCGFLSTEEAEEVCEFIGSQRGFADAYLLPEVLDEGEEGGTPEWDPSERDPMFEEAARIIVVHQQGSTSLLQRRLKLGYNRAGRLIDQLEAAGVVGPFEGSKAREVLIPDEYALEQFLSRLNNN